MTSKNVSELGSLHRNLDEITTIRNLTAFSTTPEELQDVYDKWCGTYDVDSVIASWSGPVTAARLIKKHLLDFQNSSLLDVGCGQCRSSGL